jgi:hypothetical protein
MVLALEFLLDIDSLGAVIHWLSVQGKLMLNGW